MENIYECVYYNRCHRNAAKGFWVLWDNIYYCVVTTLDSPDIIGGNVLVVSIIRLCEEIGYCF
jgi:hypothetical protein